MEIVGTATRRQNLWVFVTRLSDHRRASVVVRVVAMSSTVPFLEGAVKSGTMILISEIGDKTFFIAAIMAMRCGRRPSSLEPRHVSRDLPHRKPPLSARSSCLHSLLVITSSMDWAALYLLSAVPLPRTWCPAFPRCPTRWSVRHSRITVFSGAIGALAVMTVLSA